MGSLVIPLDLTPSGVITFLVTCVVAGLIFGMVVRLVVESRRDTI